MPKILIIQERGRHEKNREFRESLNLKRAFERLGKNCIVWGSGYDNFKISFREISKDRDVILLLENYEKGEWVPDLSNISKLKIFWSIDSHWNLHDHLKTCDKNNINILLNSTEGFLPYFEKPGRKCYYFPNCYPHDLVTPMDIPKEVNVGFCGNVVNRNSWIEMLKKEAGMKFDKFVIGHDMVKAINSYKIHWNRCIAGDTNYRIFETLGCKTFLLTNEVPDLPKLFTSWQHLVTYKNPVDCLDKIRYYLENENERNSIAESGYNHVRKHHTYDVRAKQLLEIIQQKEMAKKNDNDWPIGQNK